jgi:hypothetical protein
MAFPPTPAPPAAPPPAAAPTGAAPAIIASTQTLTDPQALELFDRCKRECFADRWRFERVWTRNIHYTNLRQWLGLYDQAGGWKDARVARGVPKPVTSKPKEAVQVIRSMFTATTLGVDVRPLRNDLKSVTTATTATKMAPVLATLNGMPDVLHEGDFWFIVTGNVVYHVSFEDNGKFIGVPFEQCATCKLEVTSDQIAQAGQKCPQCGGGQFSPALDAQGQPRQQFNPLGQTVTTALSPLEIAFPFMRARWKDVDFLIRMRWRTKRHYETSAALKQYLPKLQFTKSSSERSLQIFQSLPFQTEISPYAATGTAGTAEEEGIAEYELWMKPTSDRPEGLVLRVAGDSNPVLLHLEDSEGIPGPLPYHEANGDPLWTWHHAGYEHVGGRVIASSALDPVIHKFDQLNRLDSIVEMMMTRLAIPMLLKPKGQVVDWLGDSPAMPGLVAEYAPAPGGGKPELWRGTEVPRSWGVLREQIVNEIDSGMGISDILKGKQPQGVEAFSAMQLLVEAGEARFAGAFQSRANCFRDISRSQMEVEREYGPKSRTASVLSESKSYAFDTYETADLDGEVSFDVADGSTRPKTSLGERAAIEHLHQLGGVDLKNPETQYTLYQKFGQTELIPSIDKQHQRALQNQDLFEKWARQQGQRLITFIPQPPPEPVPGQPPPPPAAPPPDPTSDPTYPLKVRPWYDAPIHRIELLKWAVSDAMSELFSELPPAEYFVGKYLKDLEDRISQQQQPPPERMRTSITLNGQDLGDPQVREAFDRAQQLPPPGPPSADNAGPPKPPQGASLGMRNSNQNSAPVGNTPQPGSAALVAH